MPSDFRRAYTAGQDAYQRSARRWTRWLFLLGLLVVVTVWRIYSPPSYAIISLGMAWVLLMLICLRAWSRRGEK